MKAKNFRQRSKHPLSAESLLTDVKRTPDIPFETHEKLTSFKGFRRVYDLYSTSRTRPSIADELIQRQQNN